METGDHLRKDHLEIVYSKYDVRKITETLDYILDVRDGLFFNTVFRGRRLNYIKGEEYRRMELRGRETRWSRLKRTVRSKYFWKEVVLLSPFWYFSISWLFEWAGIPIWSTYELSWKIIWGLPITWICYKIYKPVVIQIYWGKQKDMLIWEDREDHKYHLLSEPVFYGFFGKVELERKTSNIENTALKSLENSYLEAARDLSWMRCLGTLSESIQSLADQYDEENIEIEILEEEGCNDTDRYGNYTILFKTSKENMPDAIIPVKEQVVMKSYTVPFVIGEKLVQKYRKTGIFDLSIYDECYEEIVASGIIGETEE